MKVMHRNRRLHLSRVAGVSLLLLAYIPYFICSESSDLYRIYNEVYGLFSAIGVGLILLSTEVVAIVPIAVLFLVLGGLFSFDYVYTELWETYLPALITIISTVLCLSLYVILSIRHKRK